MSKVLALAKKEWITYFKSPMAYIILILTTSIFHVFFFMIIDQNQEAVLRDVFRVMEFMFIFFIPLLTMRIFAEEKAYGTIEFLMTSPLRPSTIILGKYLGALMFFSLIIIMTFIYYGLIEYFGTPDRLSVWVGYLGVWLEGAFFLAIGVMASSWTRHQTIAAISTYAILFALYFSVSFIKYLTGPAETILRYLGTWSHLENFASGLITVGDIVYYLSGILVCLTLTRLSLETQ